MRTSTTPTSTEQKGQAGFTLIELSIVVVLLALFAVFTIPLFSRVGGDGLGHSARRLGGTIRYLYNEAALSGLEHRLIFNLDRDSYRAMVLEKNGELVNVQGTGRESRLVGDTRFQDLQIPGRGTFTSGEVTVLIHPSGWIEETLVHLQDGPDKQLTLRVLSLTGVSEISDGYNVF